jgi:mRNA interferase MazF
MEIKRGAVVICVFPKSQGKPRPAVVVQSDLFNATHATVTLCPITGTVRDYPLFRIDVPPSRSNGLKKPSQVMVDKIITIPHEHIGQVVGEVSAEQIKAINSSLQLWLALE